jgi:hypothetical protein
MDPKLSSDMARSCVPVGILLSAEGIIEKPQSCLQKTHSRNILTSVGFQPCACHLYRRFLLVLHDMALHLLTFSHLLIVNKILPPHPQSARTNAAKRRGAREARALGAWAPDWSPLATFSHKHCCLWRLFHCGSLTSCAVGNRPLCSGDS